MSTLVARAPAGIPTGGQFARHAHMAAPTDMLIDTAHEAAAPGLDHREREESDLTAVKQVAQSIRAQWPDAEHAFARIETDGSITMTHVLDAFEGLYADENSLATTRLGDGTHVPALLAGVSANGSWTADTAKPMLHGGPPNQRTLRIDLYAAASLRTARQRQLDLVRDDVTDQVLAYEPDAESWEADFRWDSADERFTVGDDIYMSSGHRFSRLNLRDRDPELLAQLDEAAQDALTDIDEDTRYCAQVPGLYLTADASSF